MVSTIVRETERKYEAADGVELPGWPGLAGVEALVGPEEQTLGAVYYDTEDLRLARAGVTLRRRRGADDAGWHLKLPMGRGGGDSEGDGDSRDVIRVGDARAGRRRTAPAELVGLTCAADPRGSAGVGRGTDDGTAAVAAERFRRPRAGRGGRRPRLRAHDGRVHAGGFVA